MPRTARRATRAVVLAAAVLSVPLPAVAAAPGIQAAPDRTARTSPADPAPADPAPAVRDDERPRARPVPVRKPALPDGCDNRPGWQQRRGAVALARLDYPVSSLGYTVRFLPARKGFLGMTHSDGRRIDVYVRSCSEQTDASLVYTLAHEVGHAIDLARPSHARRDDWAAARGQNTRSWWPCRSCASDFDSGAGDFAETFAYWRTGDLDQYASRWAPVPTREELAALAPLFSPRY